MIGAFIAMGVGLASLLGGVALLTLALAPWGDDQ